MMDTLNVSSNSLDLNNVTTITSIYICFLDPFRLDYVSLTSSVRRKEKSKRCPINVVVTCIYPPSPPASGNIIALPSARSSSTASLQHFPFRSSTALSWKSLYCRPRLQTFVKLLLLFPSRREFSIRRIFRVYLGLVVDVPAWRTFQQLITERH